MKWQTKNHIGETVTWYSEDVIERIKEIVTEPCIPGENCLTCKSSCMNKDILQIIEKG